MSLFLQIELFRTSYSVEHILLAFLKLIQLNSLKIDISLDFHTNGWKSDKCSLLSCLNVSSLLTFSFLNAKKDKQKRGKRNGFTYDLLRLFLDGHTFFMFVYGFRTQAYSLSPFISKEKLNKKNKTNKFKSLIAIV